MCLKSDKNQVTSRVCCNPGPSTCSRRHIAVLFLMPAQPWFEIHFRIHTGNGLGSPSMGAQGFIDSRSADTAAVPEGGSGGLGRGPTDPGGGHLLLPMQRQQLGFLMILKQVSLCSCRYRRSRYHQVGTSVQKVRGSCKIRFQVILVYLQPFFLYRKRGEIKAGLLSHLNSSGNPMYNVA